MSYDSSAIEVMSGGYGYSTVAGTYGTSYNRCWGSRKHAATCAGTLQTVKGKFYAAIGTIGVCKIKILRGTTSPFTLVADITINPATDLTGMPADDATGYVTLEKDCSSEAVAIQEGDFLGFFFATRLYDNGPSAADGEYYSAAASSGDQTGETVTLGTAGTARYHFLEMTVMTDEYVLFDSSDGWGDADIVNIPAPVDQPYYISLIDVDGVGANEDVTAAIKYTKVSDGSSTTLDNIIIDMTAASEAISNTYGSDSVLLPGQASDRFDVHTWVDPVNDKMDINFVNTEDGVASGGEGIYDLRHISLTNRQPYTITDVPARRIAFDQSAGSGVSIGRIVVHRKPILALGDSFVGTKVTYASLTRVGAKLDDAGIFSQDRFVINAGIAGNKVYTRGVNTELAKRWNDDVADWDLCAYRDVVVCLVNGPGLNDITSATDATKYEIAGKIVSCVGRIAAEAKSALSVGAADRVGGANDVVMCGMIPYTTDSTTAAQTDCQLLINQGLRMVANMLRVPFADVWEYPYDQDSGGHPSADGITWIAGQIATAYESNIVPMSAVPSLTELQTAMQTAMQTTIEANNLDKAAVIRTAKATQNKSTGAITYYDTDGVTPLYTETESDAGSTITREIADA